MCFICILQVTKPHQCNIGYCYIHHPSQRHFLPVLAHYVPFLLLTSIFCTSSLNCPLPDFISWTSVTNFIQNQIKDTVVLTCTSSLPLLRLIYAHVLYQCLNTSTKSAKALEFSLLCHWSPAHISRSIFKTFCSSNVPTIDHKPNPAPEPSSLPCLLWHRHPIRQPPPLPTTSVRLVTNTSFNPFPAFNSVSFTMACSGCGGLNMIFWLSSCSSSTSLLDAAATNPRKGGEGFRGHMQNSGWACRPRK